MKRLLRKFQSHPDVAASALRASSDVPDSGFTFVNNSQGASAAASELSALLGDVMEMIDLDGDVSEQLRLLVHRLDREASKYDNSKLEDAELDSQWDCSRSKAQLISIAWTCSLGAYDPVARVDAVDYCVFEKDHVVLPSATGTVKALTTTIVTCSPNDLQPDNEFLPVLIVAIRGSASKVDHMVNANAEPKPIRPFIDPLCLGIESSETGQAMAHAGFLNGAEALDPIVFQRVERYVSRKQGIRCHVLFTGHSAGGAVASLLFLRFVSRPEFKSSVHFSCITFGAPPSITVPFEFHAGTDPGVCLNLINEFDIVTRADRPYILSLVNLFRSIYALPALSYDNDTSRENRRLLATYTKKVSEAHTEAALSYSTNNSEASERNNWPVPPMMYHHIGVRIVLLMRLQHSDSHNPLQLKAVEVPSSLFERLLFVRVFVHRRSSYSERVGLILDGTFNDKNGWSG